MLQVDNTDAEGRLILADALYFATHNPNTSVPPSFVMDAATLTGAISIALGDQYTGLFCNNAVLHTRINEIWPPRKWLPEELAGEEDEEEEGGKELDLDELEVEPSVVEEKILPVQPIHNSTHKAYAPSVINCLNYCGRIKGDQFWHMPSLYSKQLQDSCHLADLSNITTGAHARLGGSGSAASFLQVSFGYSNLPRLNDCKEYVGWMPNVSETAVHIFLL